MKLPALPNPQQYRAWRAAIRSEITAASGRGEEAFLWVMAAELPTATFDGLRDSEGFDSLDAKLAAALQKLATGELGRKITLETENQALKGRMINGRQILWLVHDYHKHGEERGDSNLESFINTWESTLAAMKDPPAPHIVEILFLEQIRTSQVLHEEITHYDRAERSTPHSYVQVPYRVREAPP